MKSRTGQLWPVLISLLLQASLVLSASQAAAEDNRHPAVAIIIDDMGNRLTSGKRAVALPGPLAYAFLPRARYTRQLAHHAYQADKEVLLHLPMESIERHPLDKGALTLDMTEMQFTRMLNENLAAVPHVMGVNNHMGSLLTQHPGHMFWLMQELQRNGDLYFIDSRTTRATIARSIAIEWGIPNSQRNIFLDNDTSEDAITYQLEKLVERAKKQGTALAIGHPYTQTLSVLERKLPELLKNGVRVVPVSELIRLQQQEEQVWQTSLSHSPRVAKNWKQ